MMIVSAESTGRLHDARLLFEEYAAALPFDLTFQNFQQELDGLPGEYALPGGCLLLAIADAEAVAGCVALRRLLAGVGELKRLYVRPGYRGLGIGKKLACAVLNVAADLGYETVRLDTTPSMSEAIALYNTLGFIEIAPYRSNPIEGAIYMEIGMSKVNKQRF